MAWTGAESSGGGPLLDGVSTFLGDGGLGQRDLEPLGSRGLWFLCSSVLPSGSGAGVMAGVWRGAFDEALARKIAIDNPRATYARLMETVA